MATRDIRTTHQQMSCDVCGRTLLRGEHAETYLDGGERRRVCELCVVRASHEGWVREGAGPDAQAGSAGGERRRSLGSRLRGLREQWAESRPAAGDGEGNGGGGGRPSAAAASRPRQPRHVRAVPTRPEHRTLSALESFNGSEHPRTIAGIARSLGAPEVTARPSVEQPSVVTIVVAWELCWYRYEVDLSEDGTTVHAAGQGTELSELGLDDRTPNASADEYGQLEPATTPAE